MARPGPKPKPPALQIVQGNPGHRPIPECPKPPPLAPTRPEWAKLIPGPGNVGVRRDAAAEWRRVVPVLDHLGLLSTIDGALLTDYCLSWARLLQCERALSTEGLMVDSPTADGEMNRKRNPLSLTAKEYRSALKTYVGELGLGPSSRGRLNTGGSDDEDAAAASILD